MIMDSAIALAELSPADTEVKRLAKTIDYHSIFSIQEFGSEISEKTASYTDKILETARTTALNDTGKQLNQIVIAAQEFDLQQLDHPLSRTPVIGAIFKKFAMTKEKAMARFETVKGQVDKLVRNVDSTAELLNRRNIDYQSMYAGVRQEHELLGQHVMAIELRLREMDEEMSKLRSAGSDLDNTEKIAVLEACRSALSKRSDDLKMLQHSALQMLPMVRVIQSNNLALVDKFQTIRQLTLPAWKRSFMLALALDEQKSAVELSNTIDDATNSLMKRNAELLHQNSVATAKASQRMVVDIETLREVHGKIILTFNDVRNAHESGTAERKTAIAELERLRNEMAEGMKTAGLVKAA